MTNSDDTFDLPKAYDPKITDAKWYEFWEKGGFFQADATSDKPPFSIVIPPPNVTGILHMGHALVNTLQDILVRWKRMSGYEALWIPGTDHAGIATQTVVERHLIKTNGKRRREYSREEFLNHVWAWKEKSEKTILDQLKRLGCSCDWSRLRFTMDEGCDKAVRQAFKKFYDAGCIYRDNYLVNWDPITQTALADDEVEYEERDSFLWFFKYHLADESGYVHIATTRPETMLGDTAIAVSPKDERYAHLIGQKVILPLNHREIPIIADHHVDPEFGTGMVKVTPAHDLNDYRMGLDHGLEFINILTPDGRINENGGSFEGLSREDARQAVVKAMDELGLLDKTERYRLRVGVSYRSKAVIEPYLSKQWFVKMTPFVDMLKSVVESDEVKILPQNWKQTYFHWVNNLRDWCISRQLWWGHRIPIWYNKENPDQMICYEGEGLPPEVEKNPDLWEQDPDVLDTWFSSALWPFSTLGWPEKTKDLEKFYPLSVLVTGHDILFFWVARMILMGKFVLNKLPFPETFLHGLIYGKSYWAEDKEGEIHYITGEEKRDYDLGKPIPPKVHSKWEKLSKSKGNVIDPIDMIDEYGTDAVRMSLCACANQTPQIDLDRRRFEEFKNFANKVWNGARFVFMNLEGLSSQELAKGLDKKLFTLSDHWVLSLMNKVNKEVNEHLNHYSFDNAALSSYNFFWKEFCAYYVEIAKPVLFGKIGNKQERLNKQKILVVVLGNMIRLMHPIVPFITEELFQLLKKHFPSLKNHSSDPYTEELMNALASSSCSVAPYPKLIQASDIHPEIEQKFTLAENIVYTIRNIRGEMKIPPHLSTDIYLISKEKLEDIPNIVSALVKTNKVEILENAPNFSLSATGIVEGITILIPLPEELAEKEKERLKKEKEKALQSIQRLEKLLGNEEFLEKAATNLIEKQRNALEHSIKELKEIENKLTQS